jgi:hypothetical protein
MPKTQSKSPSCKAYAVLSPKGYLVPFYGWTVLKKDMEQRLAWYEKDVGFDIVKIEIYVR